MYCDDDTGHYGEALTMKFSHKLAKVRVTLKNPPTTGELSVSVWGHKKFKVNGSELSGSSWGLISMKKMDDGSFEANVVPETYESMEFEIHQKNDNETTVATAKLPTKSKLDAGIIYPYTIDIQQNTTWVKEHNLRNKLEADIAGDIVLYYTYVSSSNDPSASQYTIKVANNAEVTITIRDLRIGYKSANPSFEDPNVLVNGPIMTIGEGAKVTLKVKEEENLFYPTEGGAGIEMKNGSSLTIGDGKENSKLKIVTEKGTATQGLPCIGSAYSAQSLELGQIIIKDVTLDLTQGATFSNCSSPAIGLTHTRESDAMQSCKLIRIENSEVKITNNGDGACNG
ncbi:fimbrillin family protein, partial [Bacteroides sp.]